MKDFFNCRECYDLLMDYLEENLDPEVKARLDEHLAACAPCVNFFRTYRISAELVHKLKEQEVQIPAEVHSRLKSFLKNELRVHKNH